MLFSSRMGARADQGARLLAVAMLAAISGWLATVSLQQDFAAYYTAGAAVARGLDPYVNHLPSPDGPWDGVAGFKHSRFLYPPLMAVLFRPFSALPFEWAKVVFTALSAAALAVTFEVWRRTHAQDEGLAARDPAVAARPNRHRAGATIFLPLVAVAWLPVVLTLERGQIDLLLLPLLAAAWRFRRRVGWAGILLATAILGKPLLLGLVPMLLAAGFRRWSAATGAALVVLGLVNIAVAGGDLTGKYLRQVLPRSALYGEGGPEWELLSEAESARASDDVAQGIARVDAHGRAYAQGIGDFSRGASLPRLLSGGAPPAPVVMLLVFGGLVAWIVWVARREPECPAWFWAGTLALVLAAPVSWAMELVWALPLFALAMVQPPGAAAWREKGAQMGGVDHRIAWGMAGVWLLALAGPFFQPAWIMSALLAVALSAWMRPGPKVMGS